MTNLQEFPGFIDPHVHFREPGYEHKETMQTGAEAALAGGVTTVCEMPNTDPPTVTIANLADKVRRSMNVTGVDIRFFFGMTEAAHLREFHELMGGNSDDVRSLRKRVSGVKLYLDHSTGNQKVDGGIVPNIFEACARYNTVLVAHCEDPEVNATAAAAHADRRDVAAHSLLRPPESEAAAIAYAIEMVRKFHTRFHVAHLSTAEGLDLVRRAKDEGLPVTCEAIPQHFLLNTDDYESLGTRMKMNPPIRPIRHQHAIQKGVMDGAIDMIATDHAPHTLQEKANPDPLKAPSGIPGVETRIPLLLTIASGAWMRSWYPRHMQNFTYDDIVRLCFAKPNEIFGLGKKTPEEGGDRVIIDLDAEWTIRAKDLHSKCGWTPYEGWKVKGKVIDVQRAAPLE